MKKVLLAGEGRNELGGWADAPPHRDPCRAGVLETLLRKVAPDGWKISDALVWKDIPKYRAGQHRGAETRAVLGLVQRAKERRFDAVVFTRDRDGDKPEHEQRERDVLRGLEEASSAIAGAPPLIGGLAVERLESWVLAATGVACTEAMRRAAVDRRLEEQGIREKDTAAMVDALMRADLTSIPEDASSLQQWLARARDALVHSADQEDASG